ncbi:MAG: DUF4294 domain-containing protein [Bacteroidetes bacterium]|uniref:DUF4294 domain-containing protein n=1 Tax=Candidatus Egerieousia excrementavium TaxID=2840778 RepID=A0A9D9GYN0_9BACT|nr:DUF4294 domain-containing protein [Candidatus Egerieousia excrementavium]
MDILLKNTLAFALIFIFFPPPLFSQQKKGEAMHYVVEGGDTTFIDNLPERFVFYRPRNKAERREWRKYYRTVYNFKKVYPYALKAKEIIADADSTLANSGFTARERERYLKQYEKRLFKEFEKPLRNMTVTQGRLLLKLLDRELGRTSYYVIKNYRGSAAAGFWQGVAKIFGSDLRQPYDKYGEDRLVEELVLLYQQGQFDYLYYSIFWE